MMFFLYGLGSIIIGTIMANILSKSRDNKVNIKVSNEELLKLQLNEVTEEELRTKYSPTWINSLTLLPLPLILGGIIVIIYSLWQMDILWLKVALVYVFIGLLIAINHVKNVDVGASGIAVTFLFVCICWPLAIVMYINKYI